MDISGDTERMRMRGSRGDDDSVAERVVGLITLLISIQREFIP